VPDVRVIPFLVSELRLPPDEQEQLQRDWWPSYAHAVIHRDGVFLFDNGVGFGNVEIDVAPGLQLIPTPGHTAGHQSLVLDSADGTVVLAGQALRSRAEWNGATEPSVSGASAAKDAAYASSVELLRSFDPVRVHFAHDPAVWER